MSQIPVEMKTDNMEVNNSAQARQESRTNLIINHLPQSLLEQDFHNLFASIGQIRNYRIMRDLQTGCSYGFGFVDYTSPDDAARAILQLNNHSIQNKRLKVSYAQPPDNGDEKETNLYVQNLPKHYAVENLEQLFGEYGKITQKLIFKDKITGLPRGVGFVRFSTKSEAFAAIEALNGQTPEGGTEPLLVKVANDNSNKRQSAYNAGFQAGLARGSVTRGGGVVGRGANFKTWRGSGLHFNRGGYATYTDMGYGGNA